jgi:class 3 adenylate cyclase
VTISAPIQFTTGERKHVTVLFSDLSGYTVMSEKMDPEEVKEIITRILGQIKSVISKYNGFIEKFAGDVELAQLKNAFGHLRDGNCAIISI